MASSSLSDRLPQGKNPLVKEEDVPIPLQQPLLHWLRIIGLALLCRVL